MCMIRKSQNDVVFAPEIFQKAQNFLYNSDFLIYTTASQVIYVAFHRIQKIFNKKEC